MSRCIDADALEELFREVIGGIAKKPEMNGNLEHMVRASAMVVEMIQDAPTIEPHCETCEAFNKTRLLIPQPQRKKGHWIKGKMWSEGIGMGETYGFYYACSECNFSVQGGYDVCGKNFCEKCGADNREDGAANADVES